MTCEENICNQNFTIQYNKTIKFHFYSYKYFLSRLTTQQLYSRRRGLESYLEQILAVKIIFESQIVQDWLNRAED